MAISIKHLPPYTQWILSLLPALIIAIIVTVFVILPKANEIKSLEKKISIQKDEITRIQKKAERLTELTLENERLRKRLAELEEQLPEEKEVSSLLRRVSELGTRSGLQILLWRPEQKRIHTSGIIYEIPVTVELSGTYHELGYFFSSLTKLDRIVNISDIRLGEPKIEKGSAVLKISFTVTTFSAIPEGEKVGGGT